MKKILIVLLAAVLVPASAFAGIFGLSLGLNTGLVPDLGSIQEAVETKNLDMFKETTTYQLGPELRVRLLFLELDVNALFNDNGVKDGNFYEKLDYQIYANAGISFSLLGFLRIGTGLGTDMFISPQAPMPIIGFATMGEERIALMNEMGGVDLKNMALTAPLNIRANVDFNIGPVAIGVEGLLPTNVCAMMFSDKDAWKLAFGGAFADWGNTKVSIYLGYNFF